MIEKFKTSEEGIKKRTCQHLVGREDEHSCGGNRTGSDKLTSGRYCAGPETGAGDGIRHACAQPESSVMPPAGGSSGHRPVFLSLLLTSS